MKLGKLRLTLITVIVISLGFLVRGYIHLGDIRDWPRTKGNITDYDSGTSTTTSYSKYRMQSQGSEEWNRIEYQYSVEGITYKGHRISPNIKRTYPYKNEEEVISVLYNPNDHTESYLLADRYHNPLLIGIFIASLVGLGVDYIPQEKGRTRR